MQLVKLARKHRQRYRLDNAIELDSEWYDLTTVRLLATVRVGYLPMMSGE